MREDVIAKITDEWRTERPDLDPDPILVVGRIHRIWQNMDQALRPLFLDAGLGNGEFNILAALRRAGEPYERTPRELARSVMVTSGAITKQIDRLEQKGLVTRRSDPDDARSRMIALSPSGRQLVDDLTPTHLDNQRRLLSALSPDQQATLADLLGAIAEDLDHR